MSAAFEIGIRKRKGNLYISPKGEFNSNSAWNLVHKLVQNYKDEKQVIIDTQQLQEIQPYGCNTFHDQIDLSRIPRDRLFFQGEKGYVIAPKGSNIIDASGHRNTCCANRCSKCRCNAHNTKLLS